jgi:uncharacterized membrane protein YhaH (DUF805 family)
MDNFGVDDYLAAIFVVGLWRAIVAFFAFFMWLYVRILRKAGYSGWRCLIIFVPLVNIVMVYVFAFSDWPSLKRLAPPRPRSN